MRYALASNNRSLVVRIRKRNSKNAALAVGFPSFNGPATNESDVELVTKEKTVNIKTGQGGLPLAALLLCTVKHAEWVYRKVSAGRIN